jgi:hypothetical protein
VRPSPDVRQQRCTQDPPPRERNPQSFVHLSCCKGIPISCVILHCSTVQALRMLPAMSFAGAPIQAILLTWHIPAISRAARQQCRISPTLQYSIPHQAGTSLVCASRSALRFRLARMEGASSSACAAGTAPLPFMCAGLPSACIPKQAPRVSLHATAICCHSGRFKKES